MGDDRRNAPMRNVDTKKISNSSVMNCRSTPGNFITSCVARPNMMLQLMFAIWSKMNMK